MVTLDFSALADVNPYVVPGGWQAQNSGVFKIEGGTLRSASSFSVLAYNGANYDQNNIRISTVLKDPSGGGVFNYYGHRIIKTGGVGYTLQIYSDEFGIFKNGNFDDYNQLDSRVNVSYEAGSVVETIYLQSAGVVTIKVLLNGVQILSVIDNSSPHIYNADSNYLRPSAWFASDSSGAGFSSVTVDDAVLDVTPTAYSFTTANGVTAGATSTSNTITVAGINSSAAVTVSNGTYSKNGGAYVSTAGTVKVGDTLTVRAVASSTASASVVATLNVGTASSTYTVVTAGSDTTPTAFTFATTNNAVASSVNTSAGATIAGIDAPSAITITGGTYAINGGSYVSTAGTVVAGDVVTVRVTASATASATVTATVTIGGVTGTYSVVTAAAGGSATMVGSPVSLGGSTSYTLPTVAAGDLILIEYSQDGNLPGVPSGFTAITDTEITWDGQHVGAVYKLAVGNEGGTNVTFIHNVTGFLTIWTNVNQTTPIAGFNNVVNGASSSPYSIVIPGITTAVANTVLYVGGALDLQDDTATIVYTTPTGFTEIGQTLVNWDSIAGAYKVQAVAGASGSVTYPLTSTSASGASGGFLFGIQPGAGGGGSDSTPNAFTFTDVTGAALSTVTTSAGITVAGIDTSAAITVSGGTYAINGGSYVSTAGTVVAGDVVTARITSSGTASTAVNVVVTIGGVSDTFTVTTGSGADTTPNAFSWTTTTGATASSVQTSAGATIAGINAAAAITITGGTYAIDGGSYVSTAGTVTVGQVVTVRVTASAAAGGTRTATVTIGGVTGTYSVVTTGTADTTPDGFSFASMGDVEPGGNADRIMQSPVSGISADTDVAISVTTAQYAIDSGSGFGAFTSSPGTVRLGDSVKIRVVASSSYGGWVQGSMTIGGVSANFDVFTRDADTVPSAFTFTPATGVTAGATSTSNTITVAGTDAGQNAAITITNGTYSKNGGAYTASAGTVVLGDTVTARVVASSTAGATVTAVVTIGTVTGNYAVTTAGASDTTPDAFTFTDVTNAPISIDHTSNTITVAGIDTAAAISITGGTYSKNGGAFTASAGTVVLGDTVAVKVTSSATGSTSVNAVLTIGGVSDTYTVTTGKLYAVTVNNWNLNNTITNGAVAYSAVLRWPMIVGSGDVNGIVLSDMGWTHGDNQMANFPNGITVNSAVLENGTVFTPVYKAGSRTWAIAPGDNDTRCETITPAMLGQSSFTRGQVLWYKARISWSAASQMNVYSGRTTASVTGSQAWYADPTATTFSTTDAVGLFTSTGTAPIVRTYGYCPIALGTFVSPSTTNVWYGSGDSSIAGLADTTSVIAGGVGAFQRALWDTGANNRVLAGMNFSRTGGTVGGVTAATGDVMAYWAQFATYGVDSWGFNTFTTSGTTTNSATALTQMQALWTKYRARGLTKIIKLKQPQYTTSTDTWATEANQTVSAAWGAGGNVDTYHGLVAARVGIDFDVNLPTPGWRGTDPFKYVAGGTSDGITPKTAPSITVAAELRTSMDGQVSSDTTPDAFTFTDVTGVAVASVQTSNAITVAGIDSAAAISITGGTYAINGGSYTASAGTVTAGQTVTVRVTASAAQTTAVNAVLTIGGVSDTYTVTTGTPSVTSVNAGGAVVAGATVTVVVSGYSNITGITFAGVPGTGLSGAGNTWTITAPALADGGAFPAVGAITVSVTDGTVAKTLASTFALPAAQTFIALTSIPSTTAGYIGYTTYATGAAIGDQVYFDTPATRATASGQTVPVNRVLADGKIESDYSGVQDMWLRKASTGNVTLLQVTTPSVADTTPNAFTFTDVTAVTPSSVQTSNAITVAGINAAAAISITGGTYSIDGGAYVSGAGTVSAGQTVTVRVTASSSYSTAVNAVLTIGGVSDTYTATTRAVDVTPAAMSFTAVTGATPSAQVVSNAQAVTAVDAGQAIAISITGGEYAVDPATGTYGAYTTSASTVQLNYNVRIRATASASASTAVTATLTVGGVQSAFVVTTAAPADTTPDAFTFTSVTGSTPSTNIDSAAATVAGVTAATDVPISVSGGQYSIDPGTGTYGAFTAVTGVIRLGYNVKVRVVSSASYNTAATATLTIGGVNGTFTATTRPADVTPDAFSFTALTNQVVSTAVDSNSITVAGTDAGQTAAISVSGGLYSKNGGAFTASAGTVVLGDTVVARVTTSASASTAATATVTIGGVSANFVATTAGASDTTPDAFTFASATGVVASSVNTSASITVAGINAAAAISITNGTYAINGGSYTSSAGTVTVGQTVTVRVTASASPSTAVVATLTIGGVTGTYSVTTKSNVYSVSVQNWDLSNVISNTTSTQMAFRWPITIGSGDVNGIIMSDLGWYRSDNNTTDFPNGFTITSAVLENGTAFAPVTKGSARSWTITPGENDTKCDVVTPSQLGLSTFARGTTLWWKAIVTFSAVSQQMPYSGRTTASVAGSQALYADSNTTFSTTDAPGVFTSTGTAHLVRTYGYCPIALGTFVAAGTPNVWFGGGDSAVAGTNDTGTINGAGPGFFQRALWGDGTANNLLAGLNFSRSGGTVAGTAGAGNARCNYWSRYAPYALDHYGFNSFTVSGTGVTAGALLTQNQTFWTDLRTNGVTKILRAKVLPYTTSTDNWTTEANQTVSAAWGVGGGPDTFNNSLAGQIGSTIDGVIAMNAARGTDPYKFAAGGTTNGTTPGTTVSVALGVEARSSMDQLIYGDIVPDAFSFTPVTGATPSANVDSAAMTVAGVVAATNVPISVTNGFYSVDPGTGTYGAYTNVSGNVQLGYNVKVRVVAAAGGLTAATATLNIGGVTGTFSATTRAIDTTPDAFTFTGVTGATVGSTVDSNGAAVTGVDAGQAVAISITGGSYAIDPGTGTYGSFITSASTVQLGYNVKVRVTASGSINTPVTATVTTGGTQSTFSVTTGSSFDTTPDAFTFASATGVALASVNTSAAATIAGITGPAAISITNGTYSINGGAYTASAGTITNGQSVTVRVTASSSASTAVVATLTIGGVNGTYSVTTTAGGGSTPTPFTFTARTGVLGATVQTSNTVTIAGLTAGLDVATTITGGTYSKNGGAFVSTAGTVTNGDTLAVRLTSSASYSVVASATLTVAGATNVFSVTTTDKLYAISCNNRGLTATVDNGAATQVLMRWPVVIGTGDVKSIVVSDLAWIINAMNTTDIPNGFTVTGAVLENGTTFAPLYKNGSRSWTIAPGENDTKCDPIFPSDLGLSTFARGTTIWWKAILTFSGTSQLMPFPPKVTGEVTNSQAWYIDPGVTTPSTVDAAGQFTTTGAPVTFNRTTGYSPIFLGAYVAGGTPNVWFGTGDSILEGSGDTATTSTGHGMFNRAMRGDGTAGQLLSNINFGRSGSFQQVFLGSPNDRIAMWSQYASYAIDQGCTNNAGLTGTGETASTMVTRAVANATKLRFFGILKVLRTKPGSRSNSTDNYTTEQNQTVVPGWAALGNVESFSNQMAAKVGTDIDGFINMNAYMGGTPYIWPAARTTDGSHGNTTAQTAAGVEIRTYVDATAAGLDIAPTAFTLTAATNAELATAYVSNSIAIAGIAGSTYTAVAITGGEYAIDPGTGTFGAYTTATGRVQLGYNIRVRVTTGSSYSVANTATLTVGGVASNYVVTTRAADVTPTAFNFTAVTGATTSAVVESNAQAVAGVDAGQSVAISITGGEYAIDPNTGTYGAYTASAGNVQLGYNVKVRLTASSSASTGATATVTVGGVQSAFVVTTAGAIDTTPDAFTFSAVSSAALSTNIDSNAIAVAGVTAANDVPISVTNGSYAVDPGTGTYGAFTSVSGFVRLGYNVKARVASSASYNTAASATVTIGGVAGVFTATTRVADTVPAAFAFTPVVNAEAFTVTESAPFTVTGVDAGQNVVVTVVGGEYAVDSGSGYGAFTALSSNVQLGHSIKVRVTSSASYSTAASVTLTVGGVSGGFSVTTRAVDTTPDAFTFAGVSGAALNAVTESAAITVAGVDAGQAVTISVSGGQYAVDSGSGYGAYTGSATTVQLGYNVKVRATAPASSNQSTTAILTIGGVSGSFVVATGAPADTTPDAFTFTAVTSAAISTNYDSTPITVAGVTAATDVLISIVGGTYSIDPGTGTYGAFTSTAGLVRLGYNVKVRLATGTGYNSTYTTTLTIGGVAGAFTATTRVADVTPGAFTFTAVSGATASQPYESNAIAVTGVDPAVDVPITVVGGTYSIDPGTGTYGAPTSLAGNVRLGYNVKTQLVASSSGNTAVTSTVTIGGVTGVYSVNTGVVDTIPDAFTLNAATNSEVSTVNESNVITVAGVTTATDVVVSIVGGSYAINSGSGFGAFVTNPGVVRLGYQVKVRLTTTSAYATENTATLTIGTVSAVYSVTTRVADVVPNAFTFTSANGAEVNAVTESAAVIIAGTDAGQDVSVSVTGGLVAVNSGSGYGAFTAFPPAVRLGYGVKVRVTASSTYATPTSATVTIGGIPATFTVTTRAADTTPTAFTFTPVLAAAVSALYESNSVTVAGVDSSVDVPISVTGGLYLVDSGSGFGAPTANAGVVRLGDIVKLQLTSGSSVPVTTTAILTIGGVAASYVVSTSDVDTTPDVFTFTPVTNAGVVTPYFSDAITVTGIDADQTVPISVNGGQYRVTSNGAVGPWSFTASTVRLGDTVTVYCLSGTGFDATTNTTLTIGGVVGAFAVTTRAADTSPRPFTFTPITGAIVSTSYESTVIVVASVDVGVDVPISVTGGEYAIANGTAFGNFTSSPGVVLGGQSVKVRTTASSLDLTPVSALLTIGDIIGTFTVTTKATVGSGIDITPDPFVFTAIANAELNTNITSNIITVTDVTAGETLPINVVGAPYYIDSGSGFGMQILGASSVKLGYRVKVLLRSSVYFSTLTIASVNIGGVVANFAVTSRAPKINPNPIALPSITNAKVNTLYSSVAASITGIETGATAVMSTTNGLEYAINRGQGYEAWTTASTSVKSNDLVKTRLLSSSVARGSKTGRLIIASSVNTFTIINK